MNNSEKLTEIQHTEVATGRTYEALVEAFEHEVGYLDPNQGRITSLSDQEKRCSLYLVGNRVIADQIISIDLRAGFYVPFRVCLYDDGGPEGGVISLDRPSSFLAALGKRELTEFGALLDRKIDDIVTALRKS